MTGVLTPEQALAYLRELNPSIEAAAILDKGWGSWVGDGGLAAQAAALLSGCQDADGRAQATRSEPGGGHLLAARESGRALVARVGGGGIVALAAEDARAALAAVRERC